MTSRVDPQAVALAHAVEEAAYQVSQIITNKEWLLHRGEDFDAILASRKAAREEAKAAYAAHVAGKDAEEERRALRARIDSRIPGTMTCTWHGVVDVEHICRAPGETAGQFTARAFGEIRDV
jgi:thiamine monophosphate kinase